jgi:hypothetical protein
MKTALRETFAWVQRRPALGTGHETRSASARNVRPTEQFSRHQAPDQIRQGDTPARPSRMPIYTALAIAPYKAVMQDEFWISILARQQHAATLFGHSGEFGERANIHKPDADAYGNLFLMNPPDSYSADPKLMLRGNQ